MINWFSISLYLSILAVLASSATTNIYVNSGSGNDSANGNSPNKAVQTLSRALKLVKNVKRPLSDDLIVHLSGDFQENLKVTDDHFGSSASASVIFQASSDGTRILGGSLLSFEPASQLSNNHVAKKLLENAGVDVENIWVSPPPDNFPSNDSKLRWKDSDCRDDENYASPPTLSLEGEVMDRARTPNLPARSIPLPEMGNVRDEWLRTTKSSNDGTFHIKNSEKFHVDLASKKSWESSVWVHTFNMYDWFDLRVKVGTRQSSNFKGDTKQKYPGNPEEDGNRFRVNSGSRFVLEGAIEYLDTPGEYHVSLGETDGGSSRGWTLMYPPVNVQMSKATAVLSLTTSTLIDIGDFGGDAFVKLEGLHIEGGRGFLSTVYTDQVHFKDCVFLNAGRDAVEVYADAVTFDSCRFEGLGGRGISFDTAKELKKYKPTESALVNSIISDFASTCRHYSEGISLGGYGTIVANNLFRSSNMASIDLVGGDFKILHNVFSHTSDGSYDDGAVHWVAESPMERGVELAYNVFFRNGVSMEPCGAETSCFQADVYLDDMAGGIKIHGNVFFKDKVLQPKPPSNAFATINWGAVFVNGGADISVYENVFVAPKDGNPALTGPASLFTQSSGGTIWPDSKKCGNTGVCKDDVFYKRMTSYKYKKDPWASVYPELLKYNDNPSSSSDWYCAATLSCPMASWNNSITCNAGLGADRTLSHRAIWPTDDNSDFEDARPGKESPKREDALVEQGNWYVGAAYTYSEVAADEAESQGLQAVLAFSKKVAQAAETVPSQCSQGLRNGASRSELVGPGNNPCSSTWAQSGNLASCDPCQTPGISCAPRDLPSNGNCACDANTPTTKPVKEPTKKPKIKKSPTKKPKIKKSPTKKPKKKKPPTKKPKKPSGNKNSYDKYEKFGYCNSNKETTKKAKNADECYKKCKNEDYKFVEFIKDGNKKECYCQKECPCMDDVKNKKRTTMFPKGYKIPKNC